MLPADLPSWLFPLVALILIRTLEFASGSRLVHPDWRAEAVRLCVHLALFGAAFVLLWRPALALLLCVSGVGLLCAISLIKRRVVFEPLVFSDLALLGQIIRHPHLYFMNRWAMILAMLAVAMLLVLLAALEAPRPDLIWAPLAAMAGLAACWRWRRPLLQRFEPELLDEATGWGSRSFGLPAALAMQWLGWLAAPAEIEAAGSEGLFPADTDIVVLQLESFADLPRRMGGRSSPFWQELTARAVHHGPLRVTSKGANTMRTEHAVLSGVANAALRYDRFDPYLRPVRGRALADTLASQGWTTVFVHPNDLRFFRRHAAMPRLGFQRLVAEPDFLQAERVGRYVSDASLVSQVLRELDAQAAPCFVFAVTIENHGPWKPGRLPGIKEPLESYQAHIANMEAALERLIQALEARPRRALLVLYGDHLPALRETVDWQVYDTDYVILDTRATHSGAAARPMAPEQLLESALELLSA